MRYWVTLATALLALSGRGAAGADAPARYRHFLDKRARWEGEERRYVEDLVRDRSGARGE